MNKTRNDKGESVIAIGAPGSLERVKVEHPALIERLNALCNGEAKVDEAINAIWQAGIRSEIETANLLLASHYGEQPDATTQLVCGVARSNLDLFCDTYAHFLKEAHANYPSDYGFPASELPAVIDRMIAAIKRGTFNKDGRAFKLTCKHLKIDHTYKAITAFITKG